MLNALVLLWAGAWMLHQAAVWLWSTVPLIIAVTLLVAVWTAVRGRRWK